MSWIHEELSQIPRCVSSGVLVSTSDAQFLGMTAFAKYGVGPPASQPQDARQGAGVGTRTHTLSKLVSQLQDTRASNTPAEEKRFSPVSWTLTH